jgi:hypothetical protein
MAIRCVPKTILEFWVGWGLYRMQRDQRHVFECFCFHKKHLKTNNSIPWSNWCLFREPAVILQYLRGNYVAIAWYLYCNCMRSFGVRTSL